jgi:hypothetical protein
LTQEATSDAQIDLKWKASKDNVSVTGYKVFRDGTQIATPTTPAYSDKGLAALHTYAYSVVASDAAGNDSPESEVVRATTLDRPPGANTPGSPADTTPPTVSLTAPASGAIVSGAIDVTADASDNVRVVGVQFLLDGNDLGAEDMTAPYSVPWNASTARSGPHVLSARARDAAKKISTSAEVNVTVDTSPPKVEIAPPANKAQVADIVNFTAIAEDASGIERVEFLVDDLEYREVTAAPYVLDWDSRTVLNGMHTLAARAFDNAKNSKLSEPITLNVTNDISRCGSATAGGGAPTAKILTPTGEPVVAGEPISFTGEGTDCGPLPDNAFDWKVDILDNNNRTLQTNSFPGVKHGSYTTPADGSPGVAVNTRYRFTLTVTAPDGQKAMSAVDIYPRKAQLAFDTAPAGLTLYVDGFPRIAPFNLDALVGSRHKLEARNQATGALSYTFASWSNGKPQEQEIEVQSVDQTYTAAYTASALKPIPITFKQQNSSTPQTNQSTVSTTYTKAQTAGSLNIVVVQWHSEDGTIPDGGVTDKAQNKYMPAAPLTQHGNLSQAIYYANSIAAFAAGNTVTVKFDGERLGVGVGIIEVSGVDPNTNPVDATSPSFLDPNNKRPPNGSVTTTAANTLLVAAVVSWALPRDVKVSTGSSGKVKDCVTRVQTGNLMTGGGIASECVLDAVDTYNATASLSGPDTDKSWVMQLVAFRGIS